MKLSLIGCLFLCSCAVGVVDPIANEEAPTPQTNRAPPPQPAEPEPDNDCKVYKDFVRNCIVTTVVCKGKIKNVDVSCHAGRELFPWEYIPDPPPPFKD